MPTNFLGFFLPLAQSTFQLTVSISAPYMTSRQLKKVGLEADQKLQAPSHAHSHAADESDDESGRPEACSQLSASLMYLIVFIIYLGEEAKFIFTGMAS